MGTITNGCFLIISELSKKKKNTMHVRSVTKCDAKQTLPKQFL